MKPSQLWIIALLLGALTACKAEKSQEKKPKPKAKSKTKSEAPKEAKPQIVLLKKGGPESPSKTLTGAALIASLAAAKGPVTLRLHKDSNYGVFKKVMGPLASGQVKKVSFADESGAPLLTCRPQANFQSPPSIQPKAVLLTLYKLKGRNGVENTVLTCGPNMLVTGGATLESGLERLKTGLEAEMKELAGTETPIHLACGDKLTLAELSKVLKIFGQLKLSNVRFEAVVIVPEEEVEIERDTPKGSDGSK